MTIGEAFRQLVELVAYEPGPLVKHKSQFNLADPFFFFLEGGRGGRCTQPQSALWSSQVQELKALWFKSTLKGHMFDQWCVS